MKSLDCRFAGSILAALVLLAAATAGSARLATADEGKEGAAASSEPAAPVSYFRDVRPVFQANCQGCHQPARAGGDYVMTEFARLLKGGETEYVAVVPGDPDKSYLVEQIVPKGGKAAMPKDKTALAEPQIETVRRWIAEGAKDDTPPSARPQYDMEHPPAYSLPPVITALDFSPVGKLLAVSGYHEVVLHNADGSGIAARLVGLSERIESLAFSPDGSKLAMAGGSPGRLGELQVWDVEKRKLALSVPVGYDTLYGASWSPDGTAVAFGCPDNSVRAVQVESGKQILYSATHEDWVLDTVFSVKGEHLLSVSRDRSMKLVEVATQRFVDNVTSITPGALKGGLHAIDRHPGKEEVLTGGSDGTPRIYRIFRDKDRKIGDDFNLIRAFGQMKGRLFDARYSRDGKRIVAGSSDTGTGQVRVYEEADGKLVATMEGQQGAVYAVAFSADGNVVASGGFDGLVRLNDTNTGRLLASFPPVPLVESSVAAGK
jgi:WD40 repeat protein